MKKSQETKETKLTSFETALQKQFKPDANAIRKYFKTAVTKRGEWLANAVMFGVLAAKAKTELKHGFSDWLESICADSGKSKRTGYYYIHIAKNLLGRMQKSKQGEPLFDAIEIYKQQANQTADEFFKTEKDTLNMLSFVFSALGESALNEILRESNANAYADDTAKKPLLKTQKSPQESGSQGEQLTFFNELLGGTRAQIETARQDPKFMQMRRAEMLEYGNYLMAQAREILETAKTLRD